MKKIFLRQSPCFFSLLFVSVVALAVGTSVYAQAPFTRPPVAQAPVALAPVAPDDDPGHVVVVTTKFVPRGEEITNAMVAEVKMRGAPDPHPNLLICSRYAIGRVAQEDMQPGTLIVAQSVGLAKEDMKVFKPQHSSCPQFGCLRARNLITPGTLIRAGDVTVFNVSMDEMYPHWVTQDRLSSDLRCVAPIRPGQIITTEYTR